MRIKFTFEAKLVQICGFVWIRVRTFGTTHTIIVHTYPRPRCRAQVRMQLQAPMATCDGALCDPDYPMAKTAIPAITTRAPGREKTLSAAHRLYRPRERKRLSPRHVHRLYRRTSFWGWRWGCCACACA